MDVPVGKRMGREKCIMEGAQNRAATHMLEAKRT